jgi:molybdenum-dependent DNA-binding transcriptional regulator ModE
MNGREPTPRRPVVERRTGERRGGTPREQAAWRRLEELHRLAPGTAGGGDSTVDAPVVAKVRQAYHDNPISVLPLLLVFREVGRAGSYNGAAITLHVMRCRVSRQVAGLQRLLGLRLVQPVTKRGVGLTAEGNQLWRFLSGCLGSVEKNFDRRRIEDRRTSLRDPDYDRRRF